MKFTAALVFVSVAFAHPQTDSDSTTTHASIVDSNKKVETKVESPKKVETLNEHPVEAQKKWGGGGWGGRYGYGGYGYGYGYYRRDLEDVNPSKESKVENVKKYY
jgi:hypothetical protein